MIISINGKTISYCIHCVVFLFVFSVSTFAENNSLIIFPHGTYKIKGSVTQIIDQKISDTQSDEIIISWLSNSVTITSKVYNKKFEIDFSKAGGYKHSLIDNYDLWQVYVPDLVIGWLDLKPLPQLRIFTKINSSHITYVFEILYVYEYNKEAQSWEVQTIDLLKNKMLKWIKKE